MTRAEELLRSTTHAIASTVRDVPPLRLETAVDELRSSGQRPRRPRAGGRLGRLRPWIAPVAAAVTVTAIALALVSIRNIPNGRVTPPVTHTNSSATKYVPRYYVAWMQASTPYIVVGDTVTGKQVGEIVSPHGVYLDSIFGGAADDRTFVVTGDRVPDSTGTLWYLLRIVPGQGNFARLTPLRIPVRQALAGVAVSPDGTKLAVALPGTPAVLRVYSLATGALLRSWSAPSGQITVYKQMTGSWPYTELALRWSPDGRHLAFAWNATAIRVLDAAAADGNLLARSSELAPTVTVHMTNGALVTCEAIRGWSVLTEGNGIACAGIEAPAPGAPGSSSGQACSSAQRVTETGFSLDGHKVRLLSLVPECQAQAPAEGGDGTYIGWASPDGSTLIGSQVWHGQSRFGIFRSRGSFFTPLPALPVSVPVPTGVLIGTYAW